MLSVLFALSLLTPSHRQQVQGEVGPGALGLGLPQSHLQERIKRAHVHSV